MSRDEASLLDIARAAGLILAFKEGLDEAAFYSDLKTQSAILHQLLVLGESVKRLSDAFRAEHPEIPWRLMAGMRDKLIHGYDAVDLTEVWRVAERDIPELLRAIEPLLPKKST
jgi:uncharacterized protein with HEPN domain